MAERNATSFLSIPTELKLRPQWVLWRRLQRDGYVTKVPCRTDGRNADTSDPRTWSDFAEASACRSPSQTDGLGFVFTEADPYTGIDLDNAVLDNGQIKPWAQEIVDLFPRAYSELSPSGKGLHLIVRGVKPRTNCKKAIADGAVEIYDRGRYFTMTGKSMDPFVLSIPDGQDGLNRLFDQLFPEQEQVAAQPVNTPRAETRLDLSDTELLDRPFAGRNGDQIRRLWDGDASSYPSRSEADCALCSHLWFWTQGDRGRVEVLFRQSGLMREKWNRPDYRAGTLDRAGYRCGTAPHPRWQGRL